MSKDNFIPQIEVDQVSRDAQKARYTAYMQHFRKLENVKVDNVSGDNKAGM